MKLCDKSKVGELMKRYGFSAPDMTITEFIEDELTTISAVPVVRCRECTHYKICDEWKNGKRMLCEIHHHSYLDHDGDNYFCSWGQRKIETVLPKSDAKDKSLEGDQ